MGEASSLLSKAKAGLIPLLREGLVSLGKGLAIGFGLTIATAITSAAFASRHGNFAPRLVAFLLVLAIGGTATLLLSPQRAALRVARAVLEGLSLGSALFQVIFRYLLRVGDDQATGERMGAVGKALETRIPLSQAEERLRAAVSKVTLEKHELTGLRGWLLTHVRGTLVTSIERLTLARFRRDDQQHGAVDLLVVRDELGAGLDALLADQVKAISNRSTWLFGTIAAILSVFVTWVIYWA